MSFSQDTTDMKCSSVQHVFTAGFREQAVTSLSSIRSTSLTINVSGLHNSTLWSVMSQNPAALHIYINEVFLNGTELI